MGLISRHSGAPYQDGETLAGADLETDFGNVYGLVNGNIEAVNIKDGAVATAKIANGAVTQAKLDGTLTASTVVDGAITTPKIVDLAVTTAKINDLAVTQGKIASGSASGSEVYSTIPISYFTNTLASLTSAYSHTVGNPARHVVITLSWMSSLSAGCTIRFALYKDGVNMLGTGPLVLDGIYEPSTSSSIVTRVYVDTAPTAGGTHVYQLKGYASGTASIKNLQVFIHEPRR